MLGTLYRAVVPLAVRTVIGRCRNSIRRWWWNASWQIRLFFLKIWWRVVRRRVSTAKWHHFVLCRHKAILDSGRPLNVVFQVTCVAKWKADSVLRMMQEDSRFNPVIWYVPYNEFETERVQRELKECKAFFEPKSACLVTYASLGDFPEGEQPDVVFVNEPYDISVFGHFYNKGILGRLICYIPYGMVSTKSGFNFDQIVNNAALFNFYESVETVCNIRPMMHNGGCNAVVSGHPAADAFLFPVEERSSAWKECGSHMKKVIWAPHWSIDAESRWLVSFGTFMATGELMLEFAKKYAGDIQFAFKPHPNLYDTLCRLPGWGQKRADAFYQAWKEMPNTQLEEGAYTDLFALSDAMVHDCGSFIQEYLLVDKPCMYLQHSGSTQVYSEMAADCLNAYQIGITRDDIEAFLQMVLRGEDPKAEVRRCLREKYLVPPNGKSAAQNIIDCLLRNCAS